MTAHRSLASLVGAALLAAGVAFVAPAWPASAGSVAAPPHVVDGLDKDWGTEPTYVPGTAAYERGTWSFTDYPYDDTGSGALTYPADPADSGDPAPRYGNNAADIIAVQVAEASNAVHYLVRLNTLIQPDTTVVALAVDTDHDERTGGGPWPSNAKISTRGWDHVITVWGTGGMVKTSTGKSSSIRVIANTTANLIEFSVPFSVAQPGTGTASGTWRYRGGAGIWDRSAKQWAEAPGKADAAEPNLYNLLFRSRSWDGGSTTTDENDSPDFQSAKQASALTAGSIDAFFRDVSFAKLAAGTSQAPPYPRSDQNFTRVYASAGFPNALPEGISGSGATGDLYNGRYHPYILFVPASYWTRAGSATAQPAAPMFPMLHGWTGNHRGFNPADSAFWNQVVRPNRAIVPKPFGRGEEIWYEHVGELDVLEVMADVSRHYSVDRERTYLGGTSMGGLGTVKIVESHPDLFAGIFPSVPPMGDRAQGYVVTQNNDWDLAALAGSLRNVPVRNFTGTADGLVPAGHDSDRFCEALRSLTYDHDCWRDLTGGHSGYDNPRAEQEALLLKQHDLVMNPSHVTYVSHPAFRRQAAEAGIAQLLPYDRAYWVSGIEWPAPPDDGNCGAGGDCVAVPNWPTDPGTGRQVLAGDSVSSIDVRTYGRGVGDPVATEIADDPSPTLVRSGLVLRPGARVPVRNAFDLAATNVVGFDLDLGRMGLGLGESDGALTGLLTGNGNLTLGLRDPDAGSTCLARFGGASVPVNRTGTTIRVTLSLTSTATVLRVVCR